MYLLEVKKIKITFLVFFLLLISGFSLSLMAQENSSEKNIFLDSDQDGLSDAEEVAYGTDPHNSDTDSDGYSDGTEIKSGYDPLKPAPGDKLMSSESTVAEKISNNENKDINSENLTSDLSNKIANLVASEEAGSEGVSMDSINSLIEESLAGNVSLDTLPEISDSDIKIKKQDYSGYGKDKQARKMKEDNEEYLSAIFYIMANSLPHSISSKDDIAAFSDEVLNKIPAVISSPVGLNYFNDLANRGQEMLDKLSEIEVPIDLLDLHKDGLRLALYSVSLKDKVIIDTNDPIASIVSLSGVENVITLGRDYIDKVEARLAELDLTDFVIDQKI